MTRGFVDSVTAQAQYAEVARRQNLRKQVAQSTTQELSDSIGKSYSSGPWADPGVHFAVGQSNATQDVAQTMYDMAAQKAAAQSDTTKPGKSWWERNVYGKLKTASRWLFAATQTVPDMAQNAFSDAFDNGPEEGGTGWASSISGWWHSTSLGTMMSDSQKSGSGFFPGEQIRETQAERARRYRGEINGHAFTMGRGAARIVAPQDSIAYNLISGTVDAVMNLAADPTNAVGSAIKEYKIAKTAFEVAPDVAKAAARLAVGIGDDADQLAWNESKVVNWLKTNTKFKGLRDALAKETSASEIMKIYGDKIPPEIAKAIAAEKDPQKIEQLFVAAASRLGLSNVEDDAVAAVFGSLTPGLVPENLKAYKSGPGVVKTFIENKPFGQRMTKWFETAPAKRILVNGTSEDRANAVASMRSAINQLSEKIPAERKKKLLDMFVDAYSVGGTKRDYAKAKFVFDDFIREVLRDSDIPENVIEATIKGEKEHVDKLRAFFVNEAGQHQDGGVLEILVRAGLVDENELVRVMGPAYTDPSNLRFVGPTAHVDLMDKVHILPDFRRIRRLTANPFWRRTLQKTYATAEGEQNIVSGAADWLQNEVWKTSALATVGYIVRNILDGQIRTALKYSGNPMRIYGGDPREVQTLLTKPMDYVAWMMHRKGEGTILGNSFADSPELLKAAAVEDAAIAEHVRQSANAVASATQDQPGMLEKLVSTGDFSVVENAPENFENYVTGTVQQMKHYREDMIARMIMEGRTNAEIIDALYSTGGSSVRNSILDNLRSGLYYSDERGIRYVDPDTGRKAVIPVKIDNVNDEKFVLNTIIDTRYRSAMKPFMEAGNEELRLAFLTDRAATGATHVADDASLDAMTQLGDERRIGSVFSVDGPDGEEFWGISDINPNPSTGENMYTLHRLDGGGALTSGEGGRGSDAMRFLVKNKAGSQLLPKFTIYEDFENQIRSSNKAVDATLSGWRKINNFFFQNISAKAMKKFEKDPLYRQFYYSTVLDNVDLLAPAEAQSILDNIASAAQNAGSTAEKWATKDVIKSLEKQAASNSTQIGTARQLNEYAAHIATNKMGDVLFDAASKTNIEDALRIAAPFGSAWREVFQKYIKLVMEDPAAIVRAQRFYNGATEATMFGENGLFYKDPVTGEMMFTFPLSGELVKLLSGGKLDAKMSAPVKRLTMGFNVMPGIGPVAQMGADQFFKTVGDKPAFDEIRQILLPYGSPKPLADQLMPQWLQKMKEAWDGNKTNANSMYATTYIDVLRAMSASGKYDLSTEEGKNQLLDDASQQARIMTGFRAMSQFLGPTSGTPVYRIKTKAMEENFKGQDIYAGELVKAFQELQAKNYDTAVGEFLKLYGEEAQLYVSSKTKAAYGGLEATDEFSNFERGNSEFFNRYKDVAGYFGPKGSEFSFAAWDRQLRSGKRERLTDAEVLQTAQNAIGAYKYRQLRLQFGSYPNDLQRAWLRSQRELLAKQYPGFPVKAVFVVGELEDKITKLKQAAQYPGISNLPVTGAINDYIDAREQAMKIAEANGVSFAQSKSAQPLRDWLLAKANELISQVPEFGRVFDRELAAEIED